MNNKKRTDRLEPGEIRVIRIGKDAIFEWLAESMIAHGTDFFGIEDIEHVSFQYEFDSDACQFTCAVIDAASYESAEEIPTVNMQEVKTQLGSTTASLFGDGSSRSIYQVLNHKDNQNLMEALPNNTK